MNTSTSKNFKVQLYNSDHTNLGGHWRLKWGHQIHKAMAKLRAEVNLLTMPSLPWFSNMNYFRLNFENFFWIFQRTFCFDFVLDKSYSIRRKLIARLLEKSPNITITKLKIDSFFVTIFIWLIILLDNYVSLYISYEIMLWFFDIFIILTEPRRALQPQGTQWFPRIGLFVVQAISLGPYRWPIEFLTS